MGMSELFAPAAILVKSKKWSLTKKQVKIDTQCQQINKACAKSKQGVPINMFEQSEEPPLNISYDAESNLQACPRTSLT